MSTNRGNDVATSQTEELLQRASEIAGRILSAPSESAVMEVFRRLAYEADLARDREDVRSALH
jgi:hypothetical protein